jgi:hypothetical protein
MLIFSVTNVSGVDEDDAMTANVMFSEGEIFEGSKSRGGHN